MQLPAADRPETPRDIPALYPAAAPRNTSPWFTLALIPLVLGSQHHPGRWIFTSSALLTAGMLFIVFR